jgi:Putative Flp pilus-assembly TadE/G-like
VLSRTRRGKLTGRDDGSIMVMIIGYTVIAAVLVTVGVDVSKVFLAQRALRAAADSAALAAAEGIDATSLYDGPGPVCGRALPLDAGQAAALAARSVDASGPDLRRAFASLDPPRTALDGDGVAVTMSGQVKVPFGRVLGWLDPSRPGGLVRVTETSHAQSPVAGDC